MSFRGREVYELCYASIVLTTCVMRASLPPLNNLQMDPSEDLLRVFGQHFDAANLSWAFYATLLFGWLGAVTEVFEVSVFVHKRCGVISYHRAVHKDNHSGGF